MRNRLTLLLFILLVPILFGTLYFPINYEQLDQSAQIADAFQDNFSISANLLPISQPRLIEPVEKFKERITKKPFGIFITPETSPIQPDRFSGYHNGVDAEFSEIMEDVPVKAIADGTILVRAYALGYGGVVVVRHIIGSTPIIALYGHLDQKSFLPPEIVNIKAGDQIGILGDGHSQETDGVRKHLHFSIQPDRGNEKTSSEPSRRIDFRGYVPTEGELASWIDPLIFY